MASLQQGFGAPWQLPGQRNALQPQRGAENVLQSTEGGGEEQPETWKGTALLAIKVFRSLKDGCQKAVQRQVNVRFQLDVFQEQLPAALIGIFHHLHKMTTVCLPASHVQNS